MSSRVLVVAAHPGDEILGCGGTLALHRDHGDEVHVLILGDGWTSRVRTLEKGREALDLDVLEAQSRKSLGVLDIDSVKFCRLPDNRFDSIPFIDIVKVVEAEKPCFKPDIVYTNSVYDLNIDQRLTCQAVLTAFRPQPGEGSTRISSFETLSSTEWGGMKNTGHYVPNQWVNIQETMARKIEAFKRYSTEQRPWPHARSIEALEFLARMRGAQVGFEAAETMFLVRNVIC